jgi:hypothetical protein
MDAIPELGVKEIDEFEISSSFRTGGKPIPASTCRSAFLQAPLRPCHWIETIFTKAVISG